MNGEQNVPNDKTTALAKLLNKLDVTTLIAVLFMGGGNWFITKEDGRLTREEAERATRELHELYESLSASETRQKDIVEKVTRSLDIQSQQLANQAKLLEGQQRILNKLQSEPNQ